MTLHYSRGRNINDARPQQCQAQDFDAFVAALDAGRAPRKAGAGYVCGPLNGDGRRCAEGALSRTWLALDADKIDADTLPSYLKWLTRFRGCGWPTHSSRPDAPRRRTIIELDREATRAECIEVGRVLAHDTAAKFNGAVVLDASTHRAEQPVFLPPAGVKLEQFDGDPLPVDRYLQAALKLQDANVSKEPHLGKQPPEVDHLARDATRVEDTPAEHKRVDSMLMSINPNCSREDYMTVNRALASTGWADWRELAERWASGAMHGFVCPKFKKRVFKSDTEGLTNDKPLLVAMGSLVRLANRNGWTDPRQTNAKATNAAPAEGVSIQCAANIEPESISWAWLYWLALRKLAVLAGQAGTGKTTIAMSCAATVSIGGTWPDGKQCPRGSVLIWSGEDDPKDTLVPRLIAAGADLSRIHFVGNASDGISTRPFDPSRDMPALQERAARIKDILLVIVDPIVAAVAGDSHKNAEVRRGLAPLVAFAETIGAALLGISHFSKGTGGRDPLERVTGSVAFGAVARVVWVTAATENEDGERMHVLARAKSNIGPDDGGFSYAFEQVDLPSHPGITASKVEWGTPLVGRARDLLAEQEEKKPAKKMETVFEWLQALLQDGPVLAKDVQAQAAAAGHAWRTVERAKPWLGVQSRRSGTGNKAPFEWHLPALDDGGEL